MPNMDGTGPRCANRHAGGRSHGTEGNVDGCRCGTGSCHRSPADEKAALIARKDALLRGLEAVEKRLETL